MSDSIRDPVKIRWSVMFPVYEPDRTFLAKALSGPLGSQHAPDEFQIEVVDDCSPRTDVVTMVREIAGDRVIVSRSPQNLGLAGCWNLCVERARGEWVHILHQDDIVDSRFYDALDQVIAQNPSAIAAHTRHAVCDEEDHWLGLSVLELRKPGIIPNFATMIAGGQRLQCPSVAVRRDVYEKVGLFDSRWKYVLDWEMWTRIASSGPWAFVPELLAVYRVHEKSETQRLLKDDLVLSETWDAGVALNRYLLPSQRAEAWQNFKVHFAATVISIAGKQIEQGKLQMAISTLSRFPWSSASPQWIASWLKLWCRIFLSFLRLRKNSGHC